MNLIDYLVLILLFFQSAYLESEIDSESDLMTSSLDENQSNDEEIQDETTTNNPNLNANISPISETKILFFIHDNKLYDHERKLSN